MKGAGVHTEGLVRHAHSGIPLHNVVLQGLATVRAFRQQEAFEARNSRLMDESNRAYWPAQVGELKGGAWLALRRRLRQHCQRWRHLSAVCPASQRT